MNQLIWRLHYRQVYWALGTLAVLAVLLVVTGTNMANDYHSFEVTCAATQSCGASSTLYRGDGFIIDLVNSTLVLSALLVALAGERYRRSLRGLRARSRSGGRGGA